MSGQHSRRAILGAAVALPLIAVSCAPQPAAATPDADRRFMRLYRLWQKADAAEQAHFANAWEPAKAAYDARVAAMPHRECPVSFTNWKGEQHRFTTEDGPVRMARQIIADRAKRGLADQEALDPQFMAACRWLVDADDARKAEMDIISSETGFDAAVERDEALGDRRYALEWASIECPVSTIQALAIKCRLIARNPDTDATEYLIADVRRIAGEEA